MRIKTVLVALVVVLAAGPALAVGSAGATPTGIDGTATSVADEHLDCEFPIELTDATGETVTIEDEHEEVVVLAPNVAQHLWEIDAEEKVVGMPVNQFTSYLNGSEERTNVVGELGQPVNEEVVGLEADLVLVPNVISDEAVAELRESGETVYKYERARNLSKMLTTVERTGQLVGECEAATEKTDELEERINFVEEAVADEEQPTVFYDLGDQPSGPFTVNSNALEHDVVTTAGAENIAADIEAPRGYLEISTEVIISEQPEWVISHGGTLSNFSGYDETPALANDRVLEVDANLISQHGPRNVDVLENIAEELHPEAMADARQAAENETDDGTMDNDGNESMDDETTGGDDGGADDSGPGLTAGAAIAALVALAVVATRRD
ncbi:MAG: ABC transporter substrate-binding protein [Halovenus sp.]